MKKHLGCFVLALFFLVFSLKPHCIRVTVLKNENTDQNAVFFHDIHLLVDDLSQSERISEIILDLDQADLQGINVLVEAHESYSSFEKLSNVRRSIKKLLLGVDGEPFCENKHTLPFVSKVKTKNLAICSIDHREYLVSAMSAMQLVAFVNSIINGTDESQTMNLLLKNTILSEYSLEQCCQNLENLGDRIKSMSRSFPDEISVLCESSLSDLRSFVVGVRENLGAFLNLNFSDFDEKAINLITPILLPFSPLLAPLLDYEIVSKVLNVDANSKTTLIFAGAAHCDNVEEKLEKLVGWEKIYDSGVLMAKIKHKDKTSKLVSDWKWEYFRTKLVLPNLTFLDYQIQKTKEILVDHLFKKDSVWLGLIKS